MGLGFARYDGDDHPHGLLRGGALMAMSKSACPVTGVVCSVCEDVGKVLSPRGVWERCPACPSLTRGCSVYRVVDDGDSVRVQQLTVASLHRNGNIVLSRPFVGMMRRQWSSDDLGRVFFLTRDGAIAGYRAGLQDDIASMQRRIAAAKDLIAWANAEIGDSAAGQAMKDTK